MLTPLYCTYVLACCDLIGFSMRFSPPSRSFPPFHRRTLPPPIAVQHTVCSGRRPSGERPTAHPPLRWPPAVVAPPRPDVRATLNRCSRRPYSAKDECFSHPRGARWRALGAFFFLVAPTPPPPFAPGAHTARPLPVPFCVAACHPQSRSPRPQQRGGGGLWGLRLGGLAPTHPPLDHPLSVLPLAQTVEVGGGGLAFLRQRDRMTAPRARRVGGGETPPPTRPWPCPPPHPSSCPRFLPSSPTSPTDPTPTPLPL